MAETGEPSLFDDLNEPTLREPAGLPFGVALMGLGCIRGLGHKGLRSLVSHFGDELGSVFGLPSDDLRALLSKLKINGAAKIALSMNSATEDLVDQGKAKLAEIEAKNIKLISPTCLPEQLRSLGTESPKWLFVQGNDKLLEHHPSVAVVGTRKPTDGGCRAARTISYVLSSYPVILISGLADGIDAEAHISSLSHGIKNLAFLGHGINLMFPQETAELRAEIVHRGGAIASEYMPDRHFDKRQFVERNRLQAALADLVIPVEAASASGTAHTIRFARKYGTPIVGMRWKGAEGLVDDLAKDGEQILEIQHIDGQRELDCLLQRIVSSHGKATYPFQSLERYIAREMQSRSYRPEDVAKLVTAVQDMGQESSNNG